MPSNLHTKLIEIRDTLQEARGERLDRAGEQMFLAGTMLDCAIMALCPHDHSRYIRHFAPKVEGACDLQVVTCPFCQATAPAAMLGMQRAS